METDYSNNIPCLDRECFRIKKSIDTNYFGTWSLFPHYHWIKYFITILYPQGYSTFFVSLTSDKCKQLIDFTYGERVGVRMCIDLQQNSDKSDLATVHSESIQTTSQCVMWQPYAKIVYIIFSLINLHNR